MAGRFPDWKPAVLPMNQRQRAAKKPDAGDRPAAQAWPVQSPAVAHRCLGPEEPYKLARSNLAVPDRPGPGPQADSNILAGRTGLAGRAGTAGAAPS
jgi:hypothetical protein